MRRLLAVFGVLVMSSVLVEANTDDRLTLKTVTRTLSADRLSYTFTVDFQAPTQPVVVWTSRPNLSEAPLTLNGSMSYDTATKEGTAQLTVARVIRPVSVRVGKGTSHYFTFSWNNHGEEDLSRELNLPAANVTPSTDVAFTPGQSTRIVLTSQNDRSEDVNCHQRSYELVWGKYFNSTEGRVVEFEFEEPPFMERTDSDQGGITTITYSFFTDQYTVNSAFRESLFCDLQDQGVSPISNIEEKFELRVHEASYTGPFPDDFLEARVYRTQYGHNAVGCLIGRSKCFAYCFATANDIDSVTLLKIADDGTRTPIASKSHGRFYEIWVHGSVMANGQVATGQYVCEAKTKSGRSAEDFFNVELVTQEVMVDSIRKTILDDGKTVLVTCKGSGSNYLQVELFEGYILHDLVEGEKGVLSYTPGLAPNGGSATATVRIRLADLSGRIKIRCRVKNSASYYTRWLWV